MREIKLKIFGRVQGVFFRNEAKKKADELGIFGWVKNMDDGSVELLAEGDEESLGKFLEWCKKGPQSAVIKNVDTIFRDIESTKLDSFTIRY